MFFFSALGAFNGLFLSLYFAFFIKKRSRATYFLAALLFVISVRVTKSVFLSFYADITSSFIQVGLTACVLIGPFLYLYVSEVVRPKSTKNRTWALHIFPLVILMCILGYLYPYWEYQFLWSRRYDGYLSWFLFAQWATYIILAIHAVSPIFKKLFSKKDRLTGIEFWLTSVVVGVSFIFIAYFTNGYTSYIVGALSFSFTFYLLIIVWVFRKKSKNPLHFDNRGKYANKKIEGGKAAAISTQLKHVFEVDQVHRNPDLKLGDVARMLDIKSHELSQHLNENMEMGFSNYINSHRVRCATALLKSNDLLTLEAIGNECGFRSNSTFYAAFKKNMGVTPAQYKRSVT